MRSTTIGRHKWILATLLLVFLANACDGRNGGAASSGPVGQMMLVSFTKASTYGYKMHVAMDYTTEFQGRSVTVRTDMTGTSQLRVLSVDSMGVSSIRETLTVTKITVNGQPSTLPTTFPKTFDLRISKDGQMLGFGAANAGSPSAGGGGLGFDQITPLLSDHRVKPGDTWTKDADQTNPFGGGAIHITTSSTYERNETSHGVSAAVIETKGTPRLDVTVKLSDILKAFGQAQNPASLQLFNGVSARIVGTMGFDRTSWIDTKGKELLRTDATINMDVNETLTGLPRSAGGGAPITLPVKAKITFSLDKA